MKLGANFGVVGKPIPTFLIAVYWDIKHADLVALATDKRDLLPRERCNWAVLDGISPMSRMTLPMTPEQAEEAYLKTFFALREARKRKPIQLGNYGLEVRLAA